MVTKTGIASLAGKYTPQQLAVEGICFLIALSGVITSIRMNLIGHSLWWDEAALAYSFSQRGLLDLTGEALEQLQSAPVGWLYVLKIFTLLFGNTDFVLRVPSILAYIGIMILMYLILKKTFHVYYPMAGVAFCASLPIILQYSNIFKPYISDAFFCLLAVWFYHKYASGKWNWLGLGIGWGLLVWFSNPVCFVAGGLIAAQFLLGVAQRDGKKMAAAVKSCIPLGGSFVVYYFYWLRQTATDGEMLHYWKDWNFPLIPNSVEDLRQIVKLVGTLFDQFYRLEYIVLILLAAAVFYVIWKRDVILLGIYAGFAVAVLASGLNMYPVNKRLWMFIYPLVTIILCVCLDALIDRSRKWHFSTFVIGTVLLGCCVLNAGIRYYWQEENVFWPRYEVKREYLHLQDVIEADESVYVFAPQSVIFEYYNHYNRQTLEETGNPVIMGSVEYRFEDSYEGEYDGDIAAITAAEKCYLVMGDTWDLDYFAGPLLNGLHANGYLEMVYNEYETPMWYFCRDIEDVKSKVSLELLSAAPADDHITYTIRVQNTGQSWLNPLYETLRLNVREASGEQAAEVLAGGALPKNIAPGTYADVTLTVPAEGSFAVSLENEYGQICRDASMELNGQSE